MKRPDEDKLKPPTPPSVINKPGHEGELSSYKHLQLGDHTMGGPAGPEAQMPSAFEKYVLCFEHKIFFR